MGADRLQNYIEGDYLIVDAVTRNRAALDAVIAAVKVLAASTQRAAVVIQDLERYYDNSKR